MFKFCDFFQWSRKCVPIEEKMRNDGHSRILFVSPNDFKTVTENVPLKTVRNICFLKCVKKNI